MRERHLGFWLVALALLVAAIAVFHEILLPFVSAMVIAYFLSPLADRLERDGLGRSAAAGVIVGLLALALVLAVVVLLPLLASQIKSLAVALPTEAERLRVTLEASARERLGAHFPALEAAIARGIAELQASWTGAAGSVLAAVWNRGLALVNIVSLLLITPLVVFYLLVDWHPMLARLSSWLPRDHASTIRRLAGEMNEAIAAFIRGQGTICLALGVFYALGLTLVGLQYGLVTGLATGIAGFIPIVGWLLGLIATLALGIAQFGLAAWPLLAITLVLAAGLALDTAVLSPRFVGQKVGLHPVWLIFALFAFSYLLGFVGTLVAVPVAAAIGVLARHGLALYLDSGVFLGEASAPAGTQADQ